MNWIIPFAAIASVSVVLMSAMITVISLRDQPSTGIRRDVGVAAGQKCIGDPPRKLSDRSREVWLLYFTRCIRWPQFEAGHLKGGCSVLHLPTKEKFKPPRNEFRQIPEVTIDVSACEHFIEDFNPPNVEKAFRSRVDVTLRPNSTDHPVFLQVYCGGDFNFMGKLSKYLPIGRPVTFLDAGANIGMATLLFSQLIMGNGQVLSVEANPQTMEVLRQNVAWLPDVVVPVHAALVDTATASEKKTLTFKGRGSEYWGFRVDHNGRAQEDTVLYEVETRTLAQIQDLARSKRLDFIKLDVEGEEKWLLTDPQSREVLCSAICIFMELHERIEPGCNASFVEFMKSGCTGEQMEEVIRTGEYILLCQKVPEK